MNIEMTRAKALKLIASTQGPDILFTLLEHRNYHVRAAAAYKFTRIEDDITAPYAELKKKYNDSQQIAESLWPNDIVKLKKVFTHLVALLIDIPAKYRAQLAEEVKAAEREVADYTK